MKEAEYHVYRMPCEKDKDTEIYTNYTAFPDYRCIAKGNGTASVILMGDSIACRAYFRFNAPIIELDTDFVYKQSQSNIEFISKYTKHFVLDLPYCTPGINVGASLARKLQLGLLPVLDYSSAPKGHVIKRYDCAH
ncbi:unnamed protein product [Cylicocyclus nassatus]|uniref:Uncharacterized protein n=1 Tax=Cylicocyclus nassatus TaxID=53992 RepID=A0AA36GLJ7_CYLNA|nr:unnamed protein product [Cylicocyclus nassatus]